ncbi:hypothetical protein Tco_0613496, partial [Tanacetum coccineum]
MTSKAKQMELDNALVAPKNSHVIGKCNMRINPGMKPKEPTYQVALDALALTTCYLAFLITAEVPFIYRHQFWATVIKHKSSYQFKINEKIFSMNVKVLKEILNICPKVPDKEFDEPPTEEEALSFICELGHSGEIRKIQKKSESTISSVESPSKKKSAKAKKDVTTKPKPTKKKAPVKADRGDGTDFESGVPDEQHLKTTGADEGTGTIPGVPDVPKYEPKSEKESWGDNGEEDEDDENGSEYKSDDGKDDDDVNNDDDDANDEDNQ